MAALQRPDWNIFQAEPLSSQKHSSEDAAREQIKSELITLLPRLRRFAYGLTGSLDEGDDVVQSACERALARMDQFQPGTRLDSWMYRIVQTVWIGRWRTRQVRRETDLDRADFESLTVGDPEHEVTSRIMLGSVLRVVADLPPEQRAVLMLVCVEGQSYKSTANILDIPIGTVMSRLARARINLAQVLDGRKEASARVGGGRSL